MGAALISGGWQLVPDSEEARMRRHLLSIIICLFGFSAVLGAQQIAVMDFTVESDNPAYKYLGKGFAELTSVQLAGIPGVTLVDRARRNAALTEQEFAMSEVADQSRAIEVGRLLVVNYLVTGSIIDMLGGLTVTYEVFSIDTGAIVGKKQTEGDPSEYKRMVREIGLGIQEMIRPLSVAAAPAATPAPTPPAANQADVLNNFSEAIAALDVNDTATAKDKLDAARALDPNDPAVQYYLSKLSGGSSKFAVVPQPFFSLDNPASLGFISQDDFYALAAYGGTDLTGQPLPGFGYNVIPLTQSYGENVPDNAGVAIPYFDREIESRTFLGYRLPLGSTFGAGLQVFFSHVECNIVSEAHNQPSGIGWAMQNYLGGELTLGWAVMPWLSIGLGGSFGMYGGNVNDTNGIITTDADPYQMFWAAELGLILRTVDGSLVFSFDVGTSSLNIDKLDMRTVTFVPNDLFRIFNDMSLAWGFNQMNDFVVGKFMMDGYIGTGNRPSPFAQIMPVYEHWFGKVFSLRAGVVVAMRVSSNPTFGFGATLGSTIVLDLWEIDINATYRSQPVLIVDNETIPMLYITLDLHKKGTFVSHR
jgi:TolB-like protein